MYKYGKASTTRLETCDPRLQEVFNEAIKHMDISIFCGRRDQKDQDQAFADGKSKVKWPNGKHNVVNPEDIVMAVDAGPYHNGIDWRSDTAFYEAIRAGNEFEAKEILENIKRWKSFIGLIIGIAAAKGIKLRNGSDWDQDWEFNDQIFIDSPHFVIVE